MKPRIEAIAAYSAPWQYCMKANDLARGVASALPEMQTVAGLDVYVRAHLSIGFRASAIVTVAFRNADRAYAESYEIDESFPSEHWGEMLPTLFRRMLGNVFAGAVLGVP